MSYYVSSRGSITLPDSAIESVWGNLVSAAAKNTIDLAGANDMAHEYGTEGKIACVIAAAVGSDCPTDTWERSSAAATVTVEVWGDGDLGEVTEVLAIVASGGGTGVIHSHSDGGSVWRWRLEGGEAHDETGRVLYGDEVDNTAWIAQLHRPDDFDRVAVAASEGSAIALVASWCREDHRAYCDAAGENSTLLREGDSDIDVIETWTTRPGSVGYRVARIGDSAEPARIPTNNRETS